MRTRIKKSVYVIGSFILAAILFLAVFFFEANTNKLDSSIDSSASESSSSLIEDSSADD